MLIVGIDIGSYFTTYAYSYEYENKTFLKSAKYLSGFNLEKVVQNDTVYIIKKLLTLENNTDPVPKNFMFLNEMLTEKDFLNEIRKFVGRIAKIIPVDQDENDKKYFIISYPRGLLPRPISKIYLELICNSITKGIHNLNQYRNAEVYFITDYEALRQFNKETLLKKQRVELIANLPPGSDIPLELTKKYTKNLVLMNEKEDSNIITGVDNKDFEKAYEELLDIDTIFNSLNDIDVETYKTLYIDFGYREIRFHYSEFMNIIKPIKNKIVDDITDILIEQHLFNFCYNLTSDNQRKLRAQLKDDVKSIILPKFVDGNCETYQHEFKFEMIHILKVTKEMIDSYIQNSLLCDVIERIYENANSPIHHIELCGGYANLYNSFLTRYFPNLSIKVSNINISVGCVYFEQQLLEKEKILRNKYRDAKLDCNTQLEKLKLTLNEEKVSLSFLNKEQLDFFQRQQVKQQQLIEKSSHSPTSDKDWISNIHRRDSDQDVHFNEIIDKQQIVERRIRNLKDKIKKVEDFSKGLDKYYQSVVTSFGNITFDFFSSYSIVISSNDEEEEKKSVSDIETSERAKELLNDLKITSNSNDLKGYYFKKLGMTMEDTGSEGGGDQDTKIQVISSYAELPQPSKDETLSSISSAASSTYDNDSFAERTKSIDGASTTTNEKAPSIYSNLSGISGTGHKPGKNALVTLNSKFIAFNLHNDRIKQKAQLIEENQTLARELQKAQSKNFTLSEELAMAKQENERLKEEIEALRQKLQEKA